MTHFQSFVLGMVQGLAEFLPISSSAHLVLFPWFFGWEDPGLAFDVILHLGTLLALVVYFFKDLFRIFFAGVQSIFERKIGYDPDRQMFWWIMLGSIPGGVAGLLFHHQVETVFRDPLLIAIPLAVVGMLMYWVDHQFPAVREMDQMGTSHAIWIGLAQATAIVPGVSRSGSTITMGRLLGFKREVAARFSFLLSTPIILAAVLFEVKKYLEAPTITTPVPILITGLASSTLFGILSIHFLLSLLRSMDLKWFAWYRILVAVVILIASIAFHP